MRARARMCACSCTHAQRACTSIHAMHLCSAGTGPAADSVQPTPAFEPKSGGDPSADDNDTRRGMLEAMQVRARDQMAALLEGVESSVLMEQVLLSSETKRKGSVEKIPIAVQSTPADDVVMRTKVRTDTKTKLGEEDMGQAVTAAWTAGASAGDTAAAVGRQRPTCGMHSSRVVPTVSQTKAISADRPPLTSDMYSLHDSYHSYFEGASKERNDNESDPKRAAGGDKAKLRQRYTQPSQAELKRLWLDMQVAAGVDAKEADDGCVQCKHISNSNAHSNITHTATHAHAHTHTHIHTHSLTHTNTHSRNATSAPARTSAATGGFGRGHTPDDLKRLGARDIARRCHVPCLVGD